MITVKRGRLTPRIRGETTREWADRERKLREWRDADPARRLYAALNDIRVLGRALEDIEVDASNHGLPLEEDAASFLEEIGDELFRLTEWAEQQEAVIQASSDDADVRRKIESLRNPAGRTPAEAATARKVADRWERRIKNRLEAGAS
jgi:hypothetical protein